MPIQDQLEIVTAEGVLSFYDLSPSKGITNIGSHPENDIVLRGMGVASFHAVIDHRHLPYQLMVLGDERPTTIRGRQLESQSFHSLENWDAIELGGHTIILLLGSRATSSEPIATAGGGYQQGTGQQGFGPAGSNDYQSAGNRPAGQPDYAAMGNGPQVRSGGASPVTNFQTGMPGMPPVAPQMAPQVPPQMPPQMPSQMSPDAGMVDAPLAVRNGSAAGQATNGGYTNGAYANGGYTNGQHGLMAPVQDHIDEMILVEMNMREVTVEPEQTAAFQLTIANGGDLVSSFNVEVEGVDPNWVVILPAQINLNEGESGIVTITVTAPRHYTSVAGRYNLGITVTTQEYRDRYSQVGATLVLNPFFDVQVGDLSRKKQVSTWNNPISEAQFLLANAGNSPAQIQVEAQDEDRALHFEFQLANSPMLFARQTEVRLAPGEQTEVNLLTEPNQKRLISMRSPTHQFDVRATPLGGQQFPRVIGGQIKVSPLIGKALLFLTFFLTMLLLVVLFSPRVRTFEVLPSVVDAGTPVTMRWEASRFSSVNITGPNLLDVTPVPMGTAVFSPMESSVYNIEANNFISRVGIRLFDTRRQAEVAVTPVAPQVSLDVSEGSMTMGDSVTIAWQISQADRATLLINGNPEPIPTDQFVWSRTIQPEVDTTVRIEASNPSMANSVSAFFASDTIRVFTPTPTPLPNPSVLVFDVGPPVITAGDPVDLQWRVANSPSVTIEGVGAELPPEGNRQLFPLQTTTYVLRAVTAGGETFSDEITVVVNAAPTATPPPSAPQIEFFRANPVEYVLGAEDPVQLSWSVKGKTTAVQIFSPDLSLSANFSSTGTLPVSPAKTTFFILTATNEDQSSTAQVDITVLEPTPTATPLPTATSPPPTATPIPGPVIIFFGIESAESPPQPDEVVQTGTSQYQVVAGALIRLRWSVTTATRVSLRGIGTTSIDYGSRPFDGELILQYTGNVNQFELTGINDPLGVGALEPSTKQTINIDAIQIVPRAPTNLAGTVTSGQNQLTWSYDAASQQRITGFRIYRANVPEMNFVTVAQVPATETTFLDTFTPNCDKAYFVVATYDNFQGQTLETDPSPTSWFSPSCSN